MEHGKAHLTEEVATAQAEGSERRAKLRQLLEQRAVRCGGLAPPPAKQKCARA